MGNLSFVLFEALPFGYMGSIGMDGVLGTGVVVGMVMGVRRRPDAVARLDVYAQAMSLLQHDAGRPDLDVALDDLARRQP
jgi:hypothetical protein